MIIIYNNLEKDKPVNVSLSAGSTWNFESKLYWGITKRLKVQDFDSCIRWFESNYPSSVFGLIPNFHVTPFLELGTHSNLYKMELTFNQY